jgi:serine/threonine protein kinase
MPTLCIPSNNADRHVEALNSLYTLDYTILPNQNIVQLLSSALQLNPRVRPSLSQILTDPFFAMGSLAILKSVEVLHTRDMGTQSSVLVNLPSQLEDFPVRMLENFILPSICKLTETNNTLWTYALPVHEYLASRLSSASYKAIASACIAEGNGERPLIRHWIFVCNRSFKPLDSRVLSI